MSQETRNEPAENEPADAVPETPLTLMSRRSLLGGLMAAVVAPAVVSRAWARPALAELTDKQVEFARGRADRTPCSPTPRYLHTATELAGGRILVVGGWRHSGLPNYVPPLAEAQIYDASANLWSRAAFLNTARAQHAAVALEDGRILVVGGLSNVPLADAEIYNPAADTWAKVAPMAESRYAHAASFANGLVIVTGGFNAGPLASVQIYDVAADTWRLAR